MLAVKRNDVESKQTARNGWTQFEEKIVIIALFFKQYTVWVLNEVLKTLDYRAGILSPTRDHQYSGEQLHCIGFFVVLRLKTLKRLKTLQLIGANTKAFSSEHWNPTPTPTSDLFNLMQSKIILTTQLESAWNYCILLYIIIYLYILFSILILYY